MPYKKKTYFISDTHLGAGCHARPHDVEQGLCAFLEEISQDAEAVYLLGDILDYWFEYRNCVPQGFVRFFGTLARLADSGVKIYWYCGNHDVWLYDYLRKEIGLTVVDPAEGGDIRLINGTAFYLAHGDGVGDTGRGMRLARKIFRNKVCRLLYGSVHPRWTVGFARGCSNTSRSNGDYHHPESHKEEIIERIKPIANRIVKKNPEIEYVVMGHYHYPLSIELEGGRHLFMLGAWDERGGTYGVFDGEKFTLSTFNAYK